MSKSYNKEINVNLIVVKNGVCVDCFKGTVDEINNSLFQTYKLHNQQCTNSILKNVPRDIDIKIVRTLRVILSFFSRSKFRTIVKHALKNDTITKFNTLRIISEQLKDEYDLGKRNIKMSDFYKVMAFQLGQTMSLIQNIELYTKNQIIENYPEMELMINKTETNNIIFKKYLVIFLDMIESRINELPNENIRYKQ